MGCSAILASTSASQACGSTSFIFAVTMRLYIAAARCPPRSEPAKSHDFLPRAIPRSARSAALFDRQMRPSPRKRVKAGQRLSMYSMALAISLSRESLARCSRIQFSRSATSGALSCWRTARRCSAVWPLIDRSISNNASMRQTASKASGEIGAGVLPCAVRRAFSATSAKERATCVDPTRGLQNGAGLAIGLIQLVVPAVGVGLENPSVVGEVGLRMFGGPVARVVEHCRRRCGAAERAIVAQVNPTSPRGGLALGQDRHGGVVAVQPLGREDMSFHAPQQRLEHGAAGPHMVGQGRQTERNAFPGIALGLPIERLMLAKLLEQDHRQQAGPHQAAGDHMERCWRLADLLAIPARELLADILDDLPLPWDRFQRLGDRLPE